MIGLLRITAQTVSRCVTLNLLGSDCVRMLMVRILDNFLSVMKKISLSFRGRSGPVLRRYEERLRAKSYPRVHTDTIPTALIRWTRTFGSAWSRLDKKKKSSAEGTLKNSPLSTLTPFITLCCDENKKMLKLCLNQLYFGPHTLTQALHGCCQCDSCQAVYVQGGWASRSND